MKIKQIIIFVAAAALVFGSLASAQHFGEWSAPASVESIPGTNPDFNTMFNDGCPIQSPDELSFYMASNRPGGMGGQDIWVARRESRTAPWGAPENLGDPVNTSADDFCPTPARGKGLFFVSSRPGFCGGAANADIYFSRQNKDGWGEPEHLGCTLNSPANEFSPSYFEGEDGAHYLYFSSSRTGGFEPGGADADIYFSVNIGERTLGGFNFTAPELALGLNTAANDLRPNVRKGGREIVFDSDRAGTLGGFDIWTASRADISGNWTTPINLIVINSAANETRASLSRDGLTLFFGTNRSGVEGQADIFFSTREKLRGSER